MIVIGRGRVESYLRSRSGHKGMRVARTQFDAWLAITLAARWSGPAAVKMAHPKASILKSGRVVFNIKGNDFRLIAAIFYPAGVVDIRFFGTHAAYDLVDAETVW